MLVCYIDTKYKEKVDGKRPFFVLFKDMRLSLPKRMRPLIPSVHVPEPGLGLQEGMLFVTSSFTGIKKHAYVYKKRLWCFFRNIVVFFPKHNGVFFIRYQPTCTLNVKNDNNPPRFLFLAGRHLYER